MKLRCLLIKSISCFILLLIIVCFKEIKVNSLVLFTEVNIVRSYETDKTSYKIDGQLHKGHYGSREQKQEYEIR